MRVASRIVLLDEERTALTKLAGSDRTSERVALRARMVLLAAEGLQNKAIAEKLGVGRVQVSRWRERYAIGRLAAIETDTPRSPRPSKVDVARLADLIAPGDAEKKWSTRTLARELGVSAASISRHMRALAQGEIAAPTPERSAGHRRVPTPRGRRLLRRDALVARLADARHRRCIVIQGQAGSGKTSTLLAWRAALRSLGTDVALCTLTAQDNDLTCFLRGVLGGLGEVDPGMGREASMLTGRGGTDTDIEHWVIALVQGLAKHARDIVLMVEDLHHVEDRRIFRTLQWLLDYAPPHVHLALSSRSALPLSLQRLRSQDMLAEFDMRDLRFSLDETARYLRAQLGAIGPAEIQAIHELTDGWVAGLQLFALDLRAKGATSYERTEVRDAQTFSRYFEREVLIRLAPDDLEMLTRAAMCESFSGALCAALMGQTDAGASLESHLARLEDDNFFIARVDGRDGQAWYRPHPLLRETLLGRFMQKTGPERLALHQVASEWLAAAGRIESAVDHAVQADLLTEAADMVQTHGHDLLARGEIAQLWTLMRRLPKKVVEARFDLHLLMAYLQLYGGQTDALDESLQRMQLAADSLDRRQRYYLVLLQTSVAARRDHVDVVGRLVPALQDIPPDSSAMARSSRGNALSWFYFGQGQYDQACRVLDENNAPDATPRSRVLGLCMRAMSLVRQGEAGQAEEIVRKVLRAADAHGPGYGSVASMAAGVLGIILREAGDLLGVRQLLAPRITVIERVALPDIVLGAWVALADALGQDGLHEQARVGIDRLQAHAVRVGLPRLHAEALLMRMQHHVRQGQTEPAMRGLEQVEQFAAAHGGAGDATAASVRQVATRARVEMALFMQDWRGADQWLAPLVSGLQARGQDALLAASLLQWAIAQQGLGHQDVADTHLLAALGIGHRLGLARGLLTVSPRIPRLLQALLERGQLGAILAFYVQRLLDLAQAPDPSPRAPGPEDGNALETLSEREFEVLTLLAQAMPNKKIARAINVSPDTVKYHLKNIYAKLGVGARDEAVAALREFAARQPGDGGV